VSPRAKSSADNSVHKLKITLVNVEPPVWRRLLVASSTTLATLHSVIQGSMGWMDAHLYEFEIGTTRYGLEDEDCEFDSSFADAQEVTLAAVASAGSSFAYRYDFGDDWEHRIDVDAVEEAVPVAGGQRYPCCLDGQGACPPEDVGGPSRYEHFLEAIGDPADEDHDDYLEWVGGSFDPTHFDIQDANRRVRRTFRN
jgi:Plasmid pRiA4b ORF-3-like protein